MATTAGYAQIYFATRLSAPVMRTGVLHAPRTTCRESWQAFLSIEIYERYGIWKDLTKTVTNRWVTHNALTFLNRWCEALASAEGHFPVLVVG